MIRARLVFGFNKHCFSGILLGICIVSRLLTSSLTAGTTVDHDMPSVSMISASGSETVLSITIPEVIITQSEDADQTWHTVRTPGAGWTIIQGMAELPVFSRFLTVPVGASVALEIENVQYETLTNIHLPLNTSAEEKNGDHPELAGDRFYDQDLFYPLSPVETGPPSIMHGTSLVPLIIHPVQYNPLQKEMRTYQTISVRVTHRGGSPVVTGSSGHGTQSEAAARLTRALTLNDSSTLNSQAVERGGYLIITPDEYEEALEPLVRWKNEKGHPADVVTLSQIGSDPDNNLIREYIQDYYDQASGSLEFLMIIGDIDDVPTFFYYDVMERDHSPLGPWDATDHPYSMLDGDDYFPDLFVGRLSVSSVNELHTVVNKILSYERDPYMEQTDWYRKAFMICNYQATASARAAKLWVRDRFLENGFQQVDTSFTFSLFHCDVPGISSVINSGVSFINYRGEMDWAGWTSVDDYENIHSLNNGYMLPVITDFVCRSAAFYDDCPAEAWLRAGSVSTPKGAVACMGPTAMNTRVYFNNAMDGGFYTGLFTDSLFTPGQALARAKMELYMQYPLNRGPGHAWNSVECYYHIYTLIGDPGLEMWTGVPSDLHVEHPTLITPGATQLTTIVQDASQNPLKGAHVCLTVGGQIHSRGFTGPDGRIDLPLGITEGDTIILTATAHNFRPYQILIPCQNSSLDLFITGHLIDDDNSAGSSGDGDGRPNPGEILEVRISLTNGGTSQTASSVSAVLSSDYPGCTISPGTCSFGDIAPGQTAWSQESCLLSLPYDCQDQEVVSIKIEMTDNTENTWVGSIPLTVEAPEYGLISHTIDDDEEANPDNRPDPGETVQLFTTLRNRGTRDGEDVIVHLSSDDPNITIIDSSACFGIIHIGAESDNATDPFSLSLSPTTAIGHQVHLLLHIISTPGMTDTTGLVLTVGTRSIEDPTGPDAYGYAAYDHLDWRYIDRPIYEWIEIDPALGGSGTVLDLEDQPAPVPAIFVDYPQGDSETLSLPFDFQYYGESYDQITVCSNGWLSMGSTWQSNFRNWSIPSALSPSGLVAPFWDDLFIGDGSVVCWYDQPNHRYIVEWNGVLNDYDDALETFEVVLYDPVYYSTRTGDGEILFQYQVVDNSDFAWNYATVGIESPDKKNGVAYSYAGQYTPGSRELSDGLAVKFTTGRSVSAGPYLNYDSFSISDLEQGGGDGDGRAESGESCRLIFALQNVGNSTARGITGTLTTDDHFIAISNSTVTFPDAGTNTVVANDAEPFELTVTGEAPYHSAAFRLSLSSNSGFYETDIDFEVLIEREDVLLVDDDGGEGLESWYVEVLDILDISFAGVDKHIEGSSLESLAGEYETVIWFTGSQRDSTLTEAEQAWIRSFLQDGGHLFLTGQNIAADLQRSAFLNDWLHAGFSADSSADIWMYGTPGDPTTGEYTMLSLVSMQFGANNQISPDVIEALDGAVPILAYYGSGETAGLRYAQDYKLVFLSVGFESIVNFFDVQSGTQTRTDILGNILDWFHLQQQIGDVNEDGMVNVLDIVGAINVILRTGPDPTEHQMWASDCNGDGVVNILDVVGIVNVILGTGSCGG